MFHLKILGGISHRSRALIIIPQLPRGDDFKSTLEDLGHPQPKISVYCDNTTSVGIAKYTIKWQQSQAMEMRYFWTCEKLA
jgi:hypothetical protein